LSTCVHGEIRGTIGAAINLVEMLTEFATLFMPLIEERRTAPGEDVISDIVRATEIDTLSVAEAVIFLLIIMAAANETTNQPDRERGSVSAREPGSARGAARQPGAARSGMRGDARLCAPVQFVFRQLREAEEMHGELVPAGAVMVCHIHAASRDSRQFPDPHRFDITRPGLKQSSLSFGYGAHHCLGAALGRLEGRTALAELVPLLEFFDVDRSDLHLDRSAFTRAYERVRMVRG